MCEWLAADSSVFAGSSPASANWTPYPLRKHRCSESTDSLSDVKRERKCRKYRVAGESGDNFNIKGANMPEKEQIIITIESEKKKEFRIACINEGKNMTDILNDLIDEYLKK